MAADYFLEIEGIKGESKDDKHAGEIDLLSWSWGETQTGRSSTGGGGGSGKVSMQDFHFVMNMCTATPHLMLACATGSHIKKAVLTCRKAGGKQEEYLTIEFSDLLVSSYQTGGSSAGDAYPTDQISLNFSKIKFSYAPQKAEGVLDKPIIVGYDIKKNIPF